MLEGAGAGRDDGDHQRSPIQGLLRCQNWPLVHRLVGTVSSASKLHLPTENHNSEHIFSTIGYFQNDFAVRGSEFSTNSLH